MYSMHINTGRFQPKKIEFEIDENECHICTSHCKSEDGYPKKFHKGKSSNMSRFIYERKFGKISKGIVVRHKCDNPSCINIEHLELGTQLQNIADRVARGRNNLPKGEKNGRHRVTNDDVIKIFTSAIGVNELAYEYKVHKETIRHIKNGNSWRSITQSIQ